MLVISRQYGQTRPKNDHVPFAAVDGGLLTSRDVAAMPLQTDDVAVIGTALNMYRLEWQDAHRGRAALEMRPGQVVITPPRVAHRATWERDAAFAVAFLDLDAAVQRSAPTLCADEVGVRSLVGEVDRDVGEVVVTLARATTRTLYDRALHELSTLVLRRYADVQETSGRLPRAERERIVSSIDAHLSDDCSVAVLARSLGYSRTHFARRFKSTFGTSVHRFIVSRRVACARTLLASTTRTVSAIAAEVGFASGAHLAASFAAATGRSPGPYRNATLQPRLR